MKCPNCGAKIDDDSIFCTECGKKIEKKHKKVKQKKELLKQKRPAQSNKMVLVLAIVIPVVLIGITFGILAGLGVFSKEEAAPETIAEEYTDNAQSTEETYGTEVQEATEEVTDKYISKPGDLSFEEKNTTRLREHLDDEEILNFPPVSFMYPDDWIDLVCPDVSYYSIEYYPPDTERFETIEVVDWETNEYYKSLIEEGASKGDLALKIRAMKWLNFRTMAKMEFL
jgi:predicted  nucleic acid-binding Zn-ribbon protein